MQMARWIFEKMLFFEFYGYEKNSREIEVSRMYLMIWVISFYHLIAIAIIIMRLCAIVLHINAIGLSIPILVITFLTVTIQEITLKKKIGKRRIVLSCFTHSRINSIIYFACCSCLAAYYLILHTNQKNIISMMVFCN